MTGTFNPKLSILPVAQRTIWPLLTVVTQLEFVLYGGTAVALRLGHRVSVDFDFFVRKQFDPFVLRGQLPFLASADTLQSEAHAYDVTASPGWI